MKPYSPLWWMVVLPTSVVVGGTTFLLSAYLTDWGVSGRIVAALVLTVAADLAIAASIQVFAPTKVNIGPGERSLQFGVAVRDGTSHWWFRRFLARACFGARRDLASNARPR